MFHSLREGMAITGTPGMQDPTTVVTLPDRTRIYRAGRALVRHPLFWSGTIMLLAILALSFLGPTLYHANAYTINVARIAQPPSAAFPLGTDGLGRNVLARLMIGGQQLIEIGFASAMGSSLLGIFIGLVAGLSGGATDSILMRIVDIILGIPQLVPILFLDAIFRPSAGSLIVIVAITSWPSIARLVRADVLSVRQQLYVEASRATGGTQLGILRRHIIPNVLDVLVVAATGQIGNAVLLVATASFLGWGLPPPVPNWAGMVAGSGAYLIAGAWWLVLPAGVAFSVLQLSVYFLGDAFRQCFDPRAQTEVT